MRCFLIILFSIFILPPKTFAWPDWHKDAKVEWAENCDFDGHDLYSFPSNGQDCGGKCANDTICTHFVWTDFSDGTCWLKSGRDLPAKASSSVYTVCGRVHSRGSLADIKKGIKEGSIPIRGTNLGGWLVAEHWMTGDSPIWRGVPDDISSKGERKTMEHLGHGQGDARFDEHRRIFYTNEDFKEIAASGLNVVRITVGYWIVGFDHTWGGDLDGWKIYAPGGIDYLDKAIREWAPQNNLLVLISLHGAKGSQNGQDHSAPQDPPHAHWSAYKENVNNTLDTVEWLAKRYNHDESFLGIGLLNEPNWEQDIEVVKQYYRDAYGRIRAIPSDCLLTTSPLITQQDPKADGHWQDFMGPPGWQGIRHEWHRYQIWQHGPPDYKTPQQVIDYVNSRLASDVRDWTENWLFIGEWCLTTHGDVPIKDDETMRKYAQAQLAAFSRARGGWTYWSWKFYNDNGESRNTWSMKSMVKKGLLWS